MAVVGDGPMRRGPAQGAERYFLTRPHPGSNGAKNIFSPSIDPATTPGRTRPERPFSTAVMRARPFHRLLRTMVAESPGDRYRSRASIE
jgi:hypothetical protein